MNDNNKIIFIIGGARSGKSSFAEYLVRRISDKSNFKPAYIATAEVTDQEFENRVIKHQERRKDFFTTYEESLNFDEIITKNFSRHNVYLLECVTTWLGNVFFKIPLEERESFSLNKIDSLLSVFGKELSESYDRYDYLLNHNSKKISVFDDLQVFSENKTLVVISNETGSGIVPVSKETRSYRDLHGFINQKIALNSDVVFSVVTGIPVQLK